MAKQIYVGYKPRWYENLPVSPAVLVIALAVVVIGGGIWGLTSMFSAADKEAAAQAELQAANDLAAQQAAEEADPVFDETAVDAASGTDTINLFSALDGTSEPLDASQTAAIRESIGNFADYGYRTGFVVLDLHTGKGIGYNADEEFFCASTVKAPFAAFVSQKLLETGKASMSERLEETAVYGGTGIMADDDVYEYPLSEVMADTIVYSDNTGYALMRENYQGSDWDAWTKAAGVPQAVSAEGWYPFCDAKDLAKYWIAIDSYLDTETEEAQNLKNLFGTTEISFIRTALGSHSEVYAKAGFEIDSDKGDLGAINDAGIVSGPSGDYLIAVMSNADYDSEWFTENAWLVVDLIESLDAAHTELLVE